MNDCLYTGPVLSQKIVDIFLRFRTHRKVLAGDIEKALLTVSVSEQDGYVPRFLWFDDVKKEYPEVVLLQFAGVVFDVKAYGAFVYLQVHKASRTYVKFGTSKTRVDPLSSQTIPRLELLAAVILARLVTAIEGALKCEDPIKKITC